MPATMVCKWCPDTAVCMHNAYIIVSPHGRQCDAFITGILDKFQKEVVNLRHRFRGEQFLETEDDPAVPSCIHRPCTEQATRYVHKGVAASTQQQHPIHKQ